MITRRYLAAAGFAIVAVVASTAPRAPAKNRTTPWISSSNASYVSLPRIVKEYAHDSGAFTQGLVFGADGALYESDGLYRKSRVRRVELDTGKTLAKNLNANEHFGEGLAAIGEKLYQLTWREGAMHEYDTKTLRRLSTRAQPFHGEGWGLAYDETTGLAYGTDGTHRVHVLRPAHNWAALHVLRVKDERLGDTLIEGLNELEMVEGELWANVLPLRYHKASPCVGLRCRNMRRLRRQYLNTQVARIDINTGSVLGWVDLSALRDKQSSRVRRQPHHFVTNGIAYRRAAGRPQLLATGKQWDSMFDIDLEASNLGPDHVRSRCDLYLSPTNSKAHRPSSFFPH